MYKVTEFIDDSSKTATSKVNDFLVLHPNGQVLGYQVVATGGYRPEMVTHILVGVEEQL